jgi:5-methylcytosine-specific restriction protein A
MGRLRTLAPRLPVASPARTLATVHTERIRGRQLQAIRERILIRDGFVCQCPDCQGGKLRLRPAAVVDHRTPLWEGGTDCDENRQALSTECHALKTAAEAKRRAGG